MRKFFFLIPAMLLSLAMNAEVIYINTGTSDALRKALNNAQSGDIIEMAAGTYVESNSNWIAFTGKNVTVRAAEGANVIIQPQVSVRLKEGSRAEFINIKFDCSRLQELSTDYTHIMFPADATDNNKIILKGCEFYGFDINSSIITSDASNKLDSLVIDNCYFHNNKKSCIFLQNTNAVSIKVLNSTFENITTEASYYAGVIDMRSSSGSLLVDHCTFYNVQAMSTDYGVVKVPNSTEAVVSNSIFMMPSSYAQRAIHMIAGNEVKNCIVYNYTASTSGIHYNVKPTNTTFVDPLFTDAANADFSFPNNWVAKNVSPACAAATDGSDLGDPRWYTTATLPSTDFTTPYLLTGDKAILAGNIWYDGENGYLYGDGEHNINYGSARWKFHAEKACVVMVAANLNSGNTSGHKLRIDIFDKDGNKVEFSEEASTLPGALVIPAAGDYVVVLTDDQTWSSAKIDNISLSYMGGAVQNISTTVNTTLPIAEAWYKGCTRTGDYIQYPSSGTADAWMKWNIATSETKYYDLTVNVNTEYAHGFTVAVYEDEDAEPVASVTEGSYVNTTGTLALEIGRINLAGGKNYVVKVTNAPSGSQAKVLDVVFAPVAASATSLPGTLEFNDAVLSPNAHVTNSMLYFNEIGDTNPQGEWAQWAVTTDHDGAFLFTMDVESVNGQSYKITILDSENHTIAVNEQDLGTGTKTMKHYFELTAGNYFVKVENTKSYSKGHLTSLVVTEPSLLTIDETATTNTVIHDNYKNGNHDIQINRTVLGGMYNVICLPFDVNSTQLKTVFGSSVELYQMASATMEGSVLDLQFSAVTSIYRGTPYLIKTAANVENPIFIDVEIKVEAGQQTDGTAADFIGTFVQKSVEADGQNLILLSDDRLAFPNSDKTLKGFRGYFRVKTPGAAHIIQHARIIAGEQVVTAIDLVETQSETVQKVIENGQLIIIKDGVRYNVMGIMMK